MTRTALAALSTSLLLTACSDGDTVVTLEATPQVSIALPDVLINAGVPDMNLLRPTIQLSNGANLSMTRIGNGNSWRGEVNVEAGRSYTATVVWVEDFRGQSLPLAELVQQLEVSNDGAVEILSTSDYRTDIDFDSDGRSNLQERQNDTDPFVANGQTGGNVDEVDVIVPRIATENVPEIDGREVTTDEQGALTGQWANAVQSDNSGAPLYIDNLMIDNFGNADAGGPLRRWAALHDGTYLYIVVLVDDNNQRHRDSGTQLTQDDSLEFFIDGDNSKLEQYDDNDFHRILPVSLADNVTQPAFDGEVSGPSSSTAPLEYDFVTGPGAGPDGLRTPRFRQDIYELRVELASAGINVDSPFGFELQVNDDDDGGGRDTKWGWKHPAGNGSNVDGTMNNPSLMGTLKLE
ncbi:sugar-binding protein [Granulosicoccus sp. 3-233]|uniref:sugar-binding protein n=1 Tax=Granulosicoccus sp. 3-233 TaxID=3417969 RepID=UPI003D34285A